MPLQVKETRFPDKYYNAANNQRSSGGFTMRLGQLGYTNGSLNTDSIDYPKLNDRCGKFYRSYDENDGGWPPGWDRSSYGYSLWECAYSAEWWNAPNKCTALANCTGYAFARFNEIACELKQKYPDLTQSTPSKNTIINSYTIKSSGSLGPGAFVRVFCTENGCGRGSKPVPGCIIQTSGHVMIVEDVTYSKEGKNAWVTDDSTIESIIISESNNPGYEASHWNKDLITNHPNYYFKSKQYTGRDITNKLSGVENYIYQPTLNWEQYKNMINNMPYSDDSTTVTNKDYNTVSILNGAYVILYYSPNVNSAYKNKTSVKTGEYYTDDSFVTLNLTGINNKFEIVSTVTNDSGTWLLIKNNNHNYYILYDEDTMILTYSEKEENKKAEEETKLYTRQNDYTKYRESYSKLSNNIAPKINLLSDKARVQVPIVIVQMGDYKFGAYSRKDVNGSNGHLSSDDNYTYQNEQFPNYITSLSVAKINGSVNTYTITFEYRPTHEQDPNYFDKVFSQVGIGETITFTYGDCSVVDYLYKEEQAVIKSVTTGNFSRGDGKLSYTVVAVGAGIKANGIVIPQTEQVTAKPSELIIETINNESYGLKEIFTGFREISDLRSVIASDDKSVPIASKPNISPLDYVRYLVSLMEPENSTAEATLYYLNIREDTKGNGLNTNGIGKVYEGMYFEVIKAAKDLVVDADCYTIDVGYPTGDFVKSFSLNSSYYSALLQKFSETQTQDTYKRYIDNDGNIKYIDQPAIFGTTNINEATKKWYKTASSYPINASISLAGLLKPAMLCQYLKINVYYFGKKHISSGVYIVTGETDTLRGDFTTTLTLRKVLGDDNIEVV